MPEDQIDGLLKPGVLLRPTRSLTDADAEAVVEDAYSRFGEDPVSSPLRRLIHNPVAPVTDDDDRPTLHPIAFTILIMLGLFLVLIIICNF